MKGIVFTEFLEMVDDKFSPETTEQIIANADLPSGGAYTAVGTYDHAEIVQLVGNLSAQTGLEVPDLVRAFGSHLLGRFVEGFPHFFEGVPDGFTFLESVEGYIHGEVRKLYPDATLPKLTCSRPQPDTLVMLYESERGLADVAHGLIEGCLAHFGEDATISREDLSGGTARQVRFEITRTS